MGSRFSHTFQRQAGTVAGDCVDGALLSSLEEQETEAWQGTCSLAPDEGSFDLGSESAKVLSGRGNRMEKGDWVRGVLMK